MIDREEGRLDAVVFDMDGLLVDTEPLAHRAWLAFLDREYGRTPALGDDAWFEAMVGKTGLETWEICNNYFGLGLDLPAELPRLQGRIRAIYNEIIADGVEPMPGAIELLRACRDAGLRIGLASSSTLAQIERVVHGLGLAPLFDALTSGHEVPRSKPDPAVYRLACERLGVDPAGAVAIEDSGPGVMAARDAGLRCLAVPSHYTAGHDFSLASAVVPSLVGVTLADLAVLPW